MGCGGSKSGKVKDCIAPVKHPEIKLNGPAKVERSANTHLSSGAFIKTKRGGLDLNEYSELEKISSGSFCEVKKVLHIPTKQIRAVKIIHKVGLQNNIINQKSILHELRILNSIDHPNILRCYAIYEDDLKYYIVTEFCEGGNLFQKILELKAFTENDAAEVFRQMLSALSFCHSKGILHRDLRPENVLLDSKGSSLTLNISDFGTSCFLDVDRNLNSKFSSPFYTAPEVIQEAYNEKCDIWSCGVIMYIMLFGKPPFPGATEKEVYNAIKTQPLSFNRDSTNISNEACDLLTRMLQVDTTQRISAADALKHTWITTRKTARSSPVLKDTLISLTEFNSSSKLKEAVQMYIATQIISSDEVRRLEEAFRAIDKNGDGRISEQELAEEYTAILGEKGAEHAMLTFKKADANHSGFIDYSEFLSACLSKAHYMNYENLEIAFKMFDNDNSGTISLEEIKEKLALGLMVEDDTWKEILSEVDQNGDGVIDLKEFCALMTSKF